MATPFYVLRATQSKAQDLEQGSRPSEPGCVNPVRARTPNPARRALPTHSLREPGQHAPARCFVPSRLAAFSKDTRTFAKPQVRLPSSIRVHL